MNETTETVAQDWSASGSAAVGQTDPAPAPPASRVSLMAGTLAGPVLPTLLRLAVPTVAVLIVQTLVGVAETYFVSFLGTDALAGVALVFPVFMLMQMMSNGGIGGGVAAAVARALGSGRRDDAQALVFHALVLSCILGTVFMAAAWLAGPWLYWAMGGRGGALATALTYSNILFAASIPLWIVALLSAALRGAGNVKVPALVILVGASGLMGLSPLLVLGLGPIPRLGVAGAGMAMGVYFLADAAVLLLYLRRRGGVPRLTAVPLQWRLFRDVLKVGGLSAIGTVQSNLTVGLVTAAVGLRGVDALAGYGIASRLDYLLIPLLFGLGTAAVTMVGANVGAGQRERARRIAWIGVALGAGLTEAIGLAAALLPGAWIGLFSADPQVLETGALYLRTVAPFYGVFGMGMMLYFASQGANRVLWPVLAGTIRLLLAGLGGWVLAGVFHAGLLLLFWCVAGATLLFGAICVASVLSPGWGRLPAPVAQPARAAE